MSDYGKMDYPTAYGVTYGNDYVGYGDDYTKTCMPRPALVPENKEETKLLGKLVEGTIVQKVEVSLTDDTINKLAHELARQINLLGVYR